MRRVFIEERHRPGPVFQNPEVGDTIGRDIPGGPHVVKAKRREKVLVEDGAGDRWVLSMRRVHAGPWRL